MDRVRDRRKHRNRQHQRRLAHRLGAVDRVLAVRAVPQGDLEMLRHVGRARYLVGGGRMCEQASVPVEHQLFGGEPAHALDKAAFDLALVNCGIERAADVVNDIDALHLHLSGRHIH